MSLSVGSTVSPPNGTFPGASLWFARGNAFTLPLGVGLIYSNDWGMTTDDWAVAPLAFPTATVIATNAQPNGWAYNNATTTITAPASAADGPYLLIYCGTNTATVVSNNFAVARGLACGDSRTARLSTNGVPAVSVWYYALAVTSGDVLTLTGSAPGGRSVTLGVGAANHYPAMLATGTLTTGTGTLVWTAPSTGTFSLRVAETGATGANDATVALSCVTPPPPVPGCMDPAANNYNPLATVSDGSCTYDPPPPPPPPPPPVVPVTGWTPAPHSCGPWAAARASCAPWAGAAGCAGTQPNPNYLAASKGSLYFPAGYFAPGFFAPGFLPAPAVGLPPATLPLSWSGGRGC